jgi:tripartite-type tricarboxylate transporter receptor subunit TctC
MTINPYVFNMPLDPLRDLTLVATATYTPFVLLVNNDVPAKTLPEFITHLKANPGKLNHALNSATTILNCELLKARANVSYVDVFYRGASQAIVATQAGTTQLCFVDLGSGSPRNSGQHAACVEPHITKTLRASPRHSDHRGTGLAGLCDLIHDVIACPHQYAQGNCR